MALRCVKREYCRVGKRGICGCIDQLVYEFAAIVPTFLFDIGWVSLCVGESFESLLEKWVFKRRGVNRLGRLDLNRVAPVEDPDEELLADLTLRIV